MGYDLNIVRDTIETSSISLDEWLNYVRNDKELVLSDEPNVYNWIAYPYIRENGAPWFEYYNGYITTKNPDAEVIKKMFSIAEALKGKVQGEEGEFYDESILKSFE